MNPDQVILVYNCIDDGESVYVQKKMTENLTDIGHKLKTQNGLIYICGNGHTMVKEAELVINECMKDDGHLKELVKQDRYKKEVWM